QSFQKGWVGWGVFPCISTLYLGKNRVTYCFLLLYWQNPSFICLTHLLGTIVVLSI
ncbi:hypothetical protein ACJX0J_020711, partial [Zea mays]